MTTRDELRENLRPLMDEFHDVEGWLDILADAFLTFLREQLSRPDIIEAAARGAWYAPDPDDAPPVVIESWSQAKQTSRDLYISESAAGLAEVVRVLSEPTETK